jgi:hypothetical protein
VLQENGDVADANGWVDASYLLGANGVIKSAPVPIGATNEFFRLIGN